MTGTTFLPRRHERLARLLPQARKALAGSWLIVKSLHRWWGRSRVLAWSWWALKHLYRGGYVLSAFGFFFVWLWFFFGQADFGPVATEFVADLRELGLMAAAALGSASHLVVARLSRLPMILGGPALALAASYVLYGIARTGRPRRER